VKKTDVDKIRKLLERAYRSRGAWNDEKDYLTRYEIIKIVGVCLDIINKA
jgi:hypothetical protein